jgi:hypothetical protein
LSCSVIRGKLEHGVCFRRLHRLLWVTVSPQGVAASIILRIHNF